MSNEDKLRDYLKRATADLHKARKRISDIEDRIHEPIAIVGMACRYPGDVRTPEDLWRLVSEGGDGITEFPTDRGWDIGTLYHPDPDHPGTTYSCNGGFLHDVADFDAGLFGISPREALAMDPQQRLVLEASWEVFERAGIDPLSVQGSSTGVFIGGGTSGYGGSLGVTAPEIEGYALTGGLTSVISGRVAYTFGLEGPAVTVDTACSSSLVALHQAVQALRLGECSMALAGGVTVMPTPIGFIDFSRQRGLAPDGRCKAFAAAADGTTWSEGVGIVLVERLSEARRNGHRVLAVVRGSAVNQDGASNGLTAPNGPSQQRVIRAALANARLAPHEVDAVEAHGTGTALGDPIEAQAIIATYGQGRPEERPLWLGSVKSNIGHSAAAGGVVGVIKMVMAMHHGQLPKTLHVDAPSPHVDWSAGAVELLAEPRPWGRVDDRPRRAGVSSFGASGTNAHLIVEEAPEAEGSEQADAGTPSAEAPAWPLPVVVSAGSRRALRTQAARLWAATEARPESELVDVAASLTRTRAALAHRGVIVARDRDEALAGLAALESGEPLGSVVAGQVVGDEARAVFVFPGQGSQWAGMAADLWDSSPAFRESMTACGEALKPFVDWDFEAALADEALLARVDVVQPVLWATMISLAAVWRAHGVEPEAVVGHSQGEIAAAVVAGALSLEDGARVVALRSRAITALAGRGGMVSVPLPADQLSLPRGVSVAAVNSPRSVVVSGDPEGLETVLATVERARRIAVDYSSHSAHVESLRDELLDVLAPITPRPGVIPFYSALTGGVFDTEGLDAAYWYENLRNTVRFDDATRALLDDGLNAFVETSAHPVLGVPLRETVEAAGADASVLGTLRRGEGGRHRLLLSLGEAFVAGLPVDWGVEGRTLDLPTYPFQRRRYWLDAADDEADSPFWTAVESGELALDEDALRAITAWRDSGRDRSTVDAWRYRVEWKPLADRPARPLTGTWLLIGDATADATAERAAWAERLTAAGVRVATGTAEALPDALPDEPVDGVVSLLASAPETVELVKALEREGVDAPLWLVTRGAVLGVTEPQQAQIWGLGRVISLEHPDRWGGLLDVPAELDDAAWSAALAALAGIDDEDQLAVRDGGLLARRLAHAALSGREADTPWRPRGTVLVTGGTGALGAHTARWLADGGAEHLVLVSRRGQQAPGAEELTAELTARGVRVTVAACDVADREALAALLEGLEGPAVTAVVHAAGVAPAAPLADTTADDFAAAFAAKVVGTHNLHDLLPGPLDAFVLFSSHAGLWGSAGQGPYAAANAHLDAFAEWRRAQGLAATSLAWGAWSGSGIASVGDAERNLRRRGISAMAPDLALRALGQALDHGETHVAVVDVDWDTFVPAYTVARARPLIADLPETAALIEAATPDEEAGAELARRLADRGPEEQQRMLLDLVRAQAADVLGHSSVGAVAPTRAFQELGFDSLTAVELRNRLNEASGVRLATTVIFDHPNPTALAGHLLEQVVGTDAGASAAAFTASAVADDEPIAIVGMACRYPGDVRSPEDLWRLVAEGGDAITEFPTNRGWDVDGLYHPDPDHSGTTYVSTGGFLHDVGDFDPAFFGISPREALAMDPQQRLVLETSWELFERAGIDPSSVKGSPTGVFIGGTSSSYGAQSGAGIDGIEGVEGYALTGLLTSVVSGRVAYTLGLEGPAVTVDTACSSSLVALHQAIQALRLGECSMAVAGGVTVMSTPIGFVEFSRQRGLAPDGRCKAFAAAADGTSWAEGVGLILVERLSEARRNGHRVLGVVRGTAINQDGASNGLTAPNGPSQQRVIRQALANARLASHEVDAVEAHGTGTTLGDPIEAQALLATYGRERPDDRPLWLGSIKSNIGHSASAAGVAGIIKMVMAMRHGVLPATLHVDAPSPFVDWSAGAVELLAEAREWERVDGRPRRAAVSSFGVSGTNAHVIVEEARENEAPEAPQPQAGPVPVLISGHGEQALRAVAADLAAWTGERPDAPVPAVAAALAWGRAALERRAVVVADEGPELADGLAALADGRPAEHVASGAARPVGGVAFVFPGQGAQWAGMGADLLATRPVFAQAVADCEEAFAPLVDWSLTDVLRQEAGAPGLDRVDVVQPVSFAVMVALARVWESFGIVPGAVIGHSQGEIAAAVACGALSLRDGARVVIARSKAIRKLSGRGAMASLQLSRDETAALLADLPDDAGGVWPAAVNGPRSTVISGEPGAVEAALRLCEERGARARRIAVDYASHSPFVEEVAEEIGRALAGIEPGPARAVLASSVTGEPIDTERLDAAYWVDNLRNVVEFSAAARGLVDQGYSHFVEVSAHPVLVPALTEIFEEAGADAGAWGTLRRDASGPRQLCAALGQAFVQGLDPDVTPLLPPALAGLAPDLPTYAFQRDHYWLEATGGGAKGVGAQAADEVERRFWEAVEREDLEALAATIGGQAADGPDDATHDSLAAVLPALSAWRRDRRDTAALDAWGYRVVWQALRPSPGPDQLTGTWLLALPLGHDDDPTAALCERALSEAGARVHRVTVECTSDPAGDRAKLTAALAEHADATGVLSLLALADAIAPGHRTLPTGTAATLLLIQAWADAGQSARLWSVTREGVHTGADDAGLAPSQSTVWGLGRVAALEYPEGWGGLVDLPAAFDEAAAARLVHVLASGEGEDQVALRPSGAFGRRLVRAPLIGEPARRWRPDGTSLITGGTGGIGTHVARWLADHGAEHLLLISRGGPNAPGAAELESDLLARGAGRVTIASCDVSDRDALAALLADACATHPLRSVFHTAAVLDDAMLADLTPEQMDTVLRVKAGGALTLHELSKDLDLTAFVLFSSTAASFGFPGLGNYVPGNAYLDTLAEWRREQGLPGTSIGWGTWAGGGMAEGAVGDRARTHGMMDMPPELALAALGQALDHEETHRVVNDLRWERFTLIFTDERPSRFLDEIDEARRAIAASTGGDEGAGPDPAAELRGALAGQSPAEQTLVLLDLLTREIAAVLGHRGADAVSPADAFKDLGFDSLTAVDLRNRLRSATGLALPSSMVFDYPNPQALAEHLRAELAGSLDEAPPLRAELDRLEAVLTARPAGDEDEQAEIAARLRALLLRWQGAADPADDEDDDLDTASDSELFELLDDELGTS
ncbi:type I polyketide synthase [Streptomyces radicis]|uniref:SDR family NAD(P)-dependent oxidoreductase n=1 Tax=Streptomyces radicis TaxID=1750517 RepID=A0A3A9WG16_9ACTN|nr:type I polyketide synthase [Streptomyces radicis]RKN08364.1 SDR family NAD(P)-dependent oxidoreductase [Streptomyces radicis]RKN21601.1 SDR family NAD(P)-dependent oxidoreductase [Streptomyces radicis]